VLRTSSKPGAILSTNFMEACIIELYEKVPFLLDILCTVATGQFTMPSLSILLGPVYFIESVDFTIKTQFINSAQMQLRLQEACFLNRKGGKGKCVETDLAMEHSVRNAKDLIKGLGSNKTEKAIIRASLAADTVTAVTRYYEQVLGVQKATDAHTKRISEKDLGTISKKLRKLRPFRFTDGRCYAGMAHVAYTPFTRINREELKQALRRNINRSCLGKVPVDEPGDPCMTVV
jgi:hypothetical protein